MNLLFLFSTGCALIQLLSAHTTDLDEKLWQTKIELIKIHIQETSPEHERSYRVHWDKSWRVLLTDKYRPFMINIFDGIFILDGNRVMAPFHNGTSLNATLALREVDQIKENSVKFVRSIVWKNTITYLLVCYEPGLCSLYTKMQNNPLRFRHVIGHRGIPVDAKFFTQDNQVYLVIANNADKFSVPSVIYRWSGTYMDVISEVMTIGTESVTAFEYRQSIIIVFAQGDAENPRIGSEVYEFNGNDIVRIQFLSITRPISVHHYIHGDLHFVLMINELKTSNVLCWDGRGLLDWSSSLSEIEPHSLISIFHMDGNTFIVVAYDNIIQLYKLHSTSDWKNENTKRFKDGQKIMDMAISMNECTMTVTLVINEKDVYWVEQWEAEITSVPSDNSVGDADATRKCLSDLIEALQARMPAIKEAEASWEFLLPFAKDLTIPKLVRFDNMILQSGIVEGIEVAAEEEILPPHRIQQALNELERNVDDILSGWQKAVNATLSDVLNGKIVIDDAFLEGLEIDKMRVDFVNDMDMRPQEAIHPEGEQRFANPLRAEKIIAHDLEVESLCGIPSRYWTFRNNTTNVLAAVNGSIEYSNDTIILHSDLAVQKLTATSLNGTIVNRWIDDLFIINRTQKIKGQITYKNLLQVNNLKMQRLNDVPVDKLMTTMTNQSFDDFFIKFLKIDNLHAERINGVPVEEAARKSRINVIKGKVNLANLYVTKNFAIDVNASLMRAPQEQPLQVYENVTILGDLHLRNAIVKRTAKFFMEDVPVNVDDMFNSLWTKSGDQTIAKEITFEAGVTIDRLNTKYLNGFAESDFLYTTMEEIPREFTNLRFMNFHVNESFLKEDRNVSFFYVEPELLVIQEKLRLQNLRAKDIIALTFNGINVNCIINGSGLNSTRDMEFPVRARRAHVENLNLQFFNGREVRFGLRVDDSHRLNVLKVPEFHVRNLTLEKVNGNEINLLTQLKNVPVSSDLNNEIVIDGDLTVKNLTVGQIGEQSTESFLDELAQSSIVMMSEKRIENLIVQNVTLESLRGRHFDGFAASVLSKSKEQTVPGYLWARVIISDNVTTSFINGWKTSQLMWVDESLTIMGNVTFTDLFVEGDVITSRLNGHDVRELYDSLLVIPAKNINLLKVNGSISWDTPSTNPTSVSYLLENTVTKDARQIITGNVTFTKDAHAWAVIDPSRNSDEIRDIISDVVIDCGEPIEIGGSKFFEDDFVADSLTVNGDLSIPKINSVDISEFNNSIVRKDHEGDAFVDVGPLIFRKDVKIERLRANDADLNASIGAAVRLTDVLPDNVVFEDLIVLNNVHLKNLDGLNFDEFARDRVTLSGDHSISCDLNFNGLITVTGNANIGKINGLRSSDFVLNDADDVQMISGRKIFEENLIVEGNVTAPRINDIDVITEYTNCVQNDENVDIYGDLIFKEDVRIQKMNTSELMNEIDLRFAIEDLKEKTNATMRSLKECEKIVKQNVNYSSQAPGVLNNIFFYLETEESLIIPGFNVTDVDVLYLEETTRLNMYSDEQPGNFCGLPEDCPCPYQLVVELSGEVEKRAQRRKFGEIVKSFHDPDGIFGVNIMTNAVSSSERCTSMRNTKEFSTISLMTHKIGDSKPAFFANVSDEIEGYWKDAELFTHNGDVYIVLAMYYNKTGATHYANSLLYRLNVTRGKSSLIQKIPMNGAWSIEILKIDQHEVFLLIASKFSKTLLHRFDPIARKFEQLRTFESKSHHVKSLSQGRDHFVLLDNLATNAVNIYKYDPISRNFYSYQSIFHNRQVNGISHFYADGTLFYLEN